MAAKRKYWGFVTPMPGATLGEVAGQCEAMGLVGLWAPQLYGSPFVPLAAAAMATSSLKLGTGVALAFTRSPLETACSALDLDAISGGRAVLGIGPSTRWWNESWYGVEYGKPLAHLREAVTIVRMILRDGASGKLGKWKGEYYDLDLDRFELLSPPTRADVPIYLPALFENAIGMAGEIADGLAGHPIWCEQWILEKLNPNLARGLEKSGRKRSDLDFNAWLYVAPGANKKECIEDARATVIFYSLLEQYERYFAECGFGAEARAIAAASKAKDEAAMRRACSDEMVEKFVIVGSPDEVRRRVDRIAEVADSFALGAPNHGLSIEKIGAYNQAIAQAFYL
ncbi:MAG TPA: LLM class flavin-dependent oxidoreductase [Steroidobacteraceae bacterium]|jgi:probable F420-dependent oxidoreductase|nr:LLM class flavin-dependent oxidoreductase [Steroidobacteraceae bacterium]